jgi:hypothetical protein
MTVEKEHKETDLVQELSADLVGYWKTQTIYAAVKLGVIDALPNPLPLVAQETNLAEPILLRLLRGLWELNIIYLTEKDVWVLTAKGSLLQPTESSSMAAAAIIWADSHYKQWQFLAEAITDKRWDQTGYFTELAKNKALLSLYQTALQGYALHDYEKIIELPCWEKHQFVIDVGGGKGAFLHHLLKKHVNLRGSLIDLPEVIDQILATERVSERCQYKGMDFFEPWTLEGDAILFLRVLHDWPDHLAIQLLQQAKAALKTQGRIYIAEMVLEENHPNGSLLDLNMLVMTGGRERTLKDWQVIIAEAGLKFLKIDYIAPVISILTMECI